MEDIFDTLVMKLVNTQDNKALQEAAINRANLFNLTEESYLAAIKPEHVGILNHSQRAAIATRICILNDQQDAADHYRDLITTPDDLPMSQPGAFPETTILNIITKHVDLITLSPQDSTKETIKELQSAGLTDTQIVEISAVIAFVNYQVRVIKGLQLIASIS
jgi:uncharacterized protein YciW